MIAKEDFLKLAEARYDQIQGLEGTANFYDYEKMFDEIWTELGRQVLEKSISEVPIDRRKKNSKQVWKSGDRT